MIGNALEWYDFALYGALRGKVLTISPDSITDKNENIYFVFGKESTGIPPKLLKDHIDNCLRIPMTDNVRALNLSNTVAIVTYEALRQQNYLDLLFNEPHKSKNFIEESE